MQDESARPDGSWRSTFVAVCIAQATAIVGFDFTLPFIPLYLQHDLGVHGVGQTALWAGLIGFGPAIPATILGPIWGGVADRFGYRFMLLRAMACASLLLTMMAFVPSPGVLLALRMVQGGLTGTIFASQALVAATVPERETGRSMGLLQMSVSIGATAGPVAGGIVAQAMGYRAPFVAAGILIALAGVVVLFFVHEPERRAERHESAPAQASTFSVLRVPAFAAALALTLVTQLAATAMFPIIPLFVQDLLRGAGNVASDTGWLMALSGVASATGAYAAGRLQRRVGLRPLLVAGMVISCVGLVPMAIANSYLQFLALRFVVALSFGALSSVVGIWAAISSPKEAKGRAFGLMGAASSLGFGAGPLLGGALAATGGLRSVFVLSAALLAAVPLSLAAASAVGAAARRLRPAVQPAR